MPTDPGFPLPLIVDPPRICIQIEIPNEQYHIAAFLGNFVNLGYWFNWQRDADHTGLAVSKIWYDIFLQVAQQISLGGNCLPDIAGFAGADDGSDFMIRQNPENPCLLESSVNGTDWCVFADISKCMNFGSQPGTGSPQPQPGGGTQQTCSKLNANGRLLIPTSVSTGDTITLESASGAGNDPNEGSPGLAWRLPNGDQFFAGVDVGFPVFKSGDPLPSVHHMKIIAGLGNTPTYVDLPVGTPVTVPGGITNAQLWVQVNDDDLSNDLGSYDVCVTVTNNHSSGFTHTFDFVAGSGFWTLTSLPWGNNGEYVLGSGWHGTCNGDSDKYNQIVIQRSNPDSTVMFTDISLQFDETSGEAANTITSYVFAHHLDGSDETLITKPSDNTSSPSVWHGSTTNVAYFWMIWSCGIDRGGSCPVSGDVLIPKIIVGGTGTDPF